MSREAREWVWNDAPITDPRQMLILLSLADVANEHGGGSYPSKQRLAADSRSDPRTVQRHLRTMVDLGILAVEEKATQHRPTTYMLAAFRGDNLSPLDSPGETPGEAQGRHRGDTGETPAASSPLIGTGKGSGRNISEITPHHTSSHLVPLDAFWDIYPKRNGKRLYRNQTQPLWEKLVDEERRAAVIGARHYGEAVAQGLTIAKDPHRWLRDKCWGDWQTPAEANSVHSDGHVDEIEEIEMRVRRREGSL